MSHVTSTLPSLADTAGPARATSSPPLQVSPVQGLEDDAVVSLCGLGEEQLWGGMLGGCWTVTLGSVVLGSPPKPQ